MIFRHEYLDGVWVDLEQPSENEIREVAHEFSIGERIETELLSPTPTSLVVNDTTAALLVLHFPTSGGDSGETKSQEIDFIVGKNFILTVRYEVIAPLYHLKKLLETQKLITGKTPITTDVLLELLFAHLYTSMRDHTNHIATHLGRVEKEMFDGRERITVRSILNINREFLHVEAALTSQEESLAHFLDVLKEYAFFDDSFVPRVQRIKTERANVARIVKAHRAVASELRETNTALLEARQNEIMKTLTIITVIMLPLELIAVTFGIHAQGAPFENDLNAFWIIIMMMIGIAGGMILFFMRKRWIF